MSAAPTRRTDLVVHELDGEAILYDPIAQLTHRLNRTALFIWCHCDGRSSAADIARALAASFDVDPARADDDVRRALEQMSDNLLLDTPEAAPAA